MQETRQHLEKFTKEKMATLDRNCSGSSKIEQSFSEASKSAATFTATVAQMEKRLKDLTKFIAQADLEVKNDLQGLDSKN